MNDRMMVVAGVALMMGRLHKAVETGCEALPVIIGVSKDEAKPDLEQLLEKLQEAKAILDKMIADGKAKAEAMGVNLPPLRGFEQEMGNA